MSVFYSYLFLPIDYEIHLQMVKQLHSQGKTTIETLQLGILETS